MKQRKTKKTWLSMIRSGCLGCLGVSIAAVLVLTAAAAGTAVGIFRTIGDQVNSIKIGDYEPVINTKIYDRNGVLIEELHRGEDRTSRVPLAHISPFLSSAVMVAEDEKFLRHHGIDLPAVVRSVITNLRAGRVVGGASTITMQLAKCAFLVHERTMSYKLKQAMLAIRLEQIYTKEEILELYLNEIHFGHGTNGVASASRKFFETSPEELTLPQATLLAATIKSPTYYSPWLHPDRCKMRRDYILKRMGNLGYITSEQLDEAINSPLGVVARQAGTLCEAPHFIYSFLLPKLKTFFKETTGSADTLFKGGYKIYTTIDLRMQRAAEKALKEAAVFKKLADQPDIDGALISMNPHNGEIMAMVGGRSFQRSKFNRTVDARRQPGSAFKPIIYLAAVDNGISPNKIINDMPSQYPDPWTGEIWQPKNYEDEYHGPTTLMESLIHSFNIVAIELLREVGMDNVIRYARRMGITSPISPTLSMALGTYELAPIEMASVYSTLAAGGVYSEPQYLLRIEDSSGKVHYKAQYSGRSVVDAGSVYIVNEILHKVVVRGTGTAARISGEYVAGKTGTTNEYTDAWFCGFTPDLATVVYVGLDSPRPLGSRMSGGRVAAPIWKAFMKPALEFIPNRSKTVSMPSNVVSQKICLDSGFKATTDCRRTDKMVFLRGTAPSLECNFHQPFGDMDLFESSDKNDTYDRWRINRPILPPKPEIPDGPLDYFGEDSSKQLIPPPSNSDYLNQNNSTYSAPPPF